WSTCDQFRPPSFDRQRPPSSDPAYTSWLFTGSVVNAFTRPPYGAPAWSFGLMSLTADGAVNAPPASGTIPTSTTAASSSIVRLDHARTTTFIPCLPWVLPAPGSTVSTVEDKKAMGRSAYFKRTRLC